MITVRDKSGKEYKIILEREAAEVIPSWRDPWALRERRFEPGRDISRTADGWPITLVSPTEVIIHGPHGAIECSPAE